MRVVYVDTLFFLNLSVDYLLLLLTARIAGLCPNRKRLLAGGVIGAVLAVLLYFPPLPTAVALLLRMGTLAATVLPSFADTPVRFWPRLTGIFFLLTCVLAGILLALSRNGELLQLRNGTIYAEISSVVMLIGFTAVFVLSGLVLGKGRAAPGRHWREIRAENNSRQVVFRALTDSGNLLRDPVSGRQVIVAESAVLAPLLEREPDQLLDLMKELQPEVLLMRLRQSSGMAFWLLPVRTITQNGLMVVFRPERIYVDGKEREDCLLGITDRPIDAGGDCHGLMGV